MTTWWFSSYTWLNVLSLKTSERKNFGSLNCITLKTAMRLGI